ncbi:MAG: hypothetical protein KDK76_03265, partial [Chlamydiia bacterium]|nr:hypothetical protein [Chlamydiia bacterium]
PFPPLRLSAYLTIDQKAMTFCNLSHFPLLTDLRGQQPKDIGIVPPENFPSEGPDYLAPSWRSQINQPILDTVYLKMGDKRLIESIYQNREVLPNPTETNPERVKNLASDLGRNMRGVPFVKGPGIISNAKGAFTVNGKYTYFETGGGKYQQGQFVEGGIIEVRPPYVAAPIRKTVATAPENNKLLKLTSTFSTTEDIKEAEYYLTATPVHWISPKITNFIRARIYYVFSTNFEPNEGRFFGNWHLNNFLDFLSHPQRNHQEHSGFLYQSIFTNINGQLDPPVCNFVLHDFTTIPHGTPYPECDWGLGNQNHY